LGIRPSKGLGQNFLVEHDVVDRIVQTAAISPGETVIEVGPGLGILTEHLLGTSARVTVIELDRALIPHLRRTFGDLPYFDVVEGNALNIDIEEVIPGNGLYKVVANLPYSVASAILMHFLEQKRPPESMTVMVQREVADRIVAKPPGMSVLSVATQLLSEPNLAFTVPPGSFMPPPRVDSSVLNLRPLGEARLPAEMRRRFFGLVNAGFRHKRKQLLNSLAFELDDDKNVVANRLSMAEIDPMRRAQTLTVDEWLAMVHVWERYG
jgi:16S rRNA (adenine1518-N6/adenine1519-N6)-dimethyltransferase